MLKLVLGGSGSGKTTLLYARIKARAEAGQRSILLVPEQFTSSTEGRIYRELGDALSGMVDSYSFTSLAEHILSAEGGAAVQTLSDAGRAVLVRRTLEELQDTVQYYYRHRRSAAFCQMAAETIDELKSAGLSGQQLYRLAQGCGSGSGKLTELALILQGYETLLAGTGMDPTDRLELAADRLEAAFARGSLPEFLQDRAVFIDEFDTFNAPKKRLLSALLTALPQVTVALCDDGTPLVPGDTGLFAGAKLVAAQLRQLARKSGTEVAAPELLRRDLRHKDAPGLAAVAALLEGNGTEVTQAPEVRLFPAASREEEARCAAAAIRRLMRQGVRCGKIAVVCRDIAKYRAAVRYEFRMADIPLYCDEPTTPEFSAPATAVRALLALLRGADMTEQLTVLAKTGLCALSEEQVCALENYAYTWSPNAAAWRAEFTKNPKGFGENELTDEDRQNLAWAEDARRKLVDAVDTLRGKVKGGNAEQISRAVYFCLKELGAEEQQAGLVEDIRAALVGQAYILRMTGAEDAAIRALIEKLPAQEEQPEENLTLAQQAMRCGEQAHIGRMIGKLGQMVHTAAPGLPGSIRTEDAAPGVLLQASAGYGLVRTVFNSLFGIRPDAGKKEIFWHPHTPIGWEGWQIENVKIGGDLFNVKSERVSPSQARYTLTTDGQGWRVKTMENGEIKETEVNGELSLVMED